MTHIPGVPVKFDPPNDWKEATNSKCRECQGSKIKLRTHESSCGGFEDEELRCSDCGHTWWVDGIDS